ncbi:DUF4190 domain-containing protein [Streptomyces sp. NPDC048442]|uniref:DUF4190 domain-containing protein n=1 Tax=Streptomyces sp. NPDC048442 TaxID=3154823 RepID=UPI0034209E19
MSDNTPQPSGAPDPWAPPEGSGNRVPLDKPGAPSGNPVHEQPTVTSMPTAGVGPEDAIPGSAPAPAPAPAPGAPAAYGYPVQGAPPGVTPGEYGYPSAYPAAPSAPYGGGYPGYPGYAGPSGWTGQGQPQNGFGVAAMVLGILSICLFCVYGVMGIVLGAMGLIFGILGRKKAERGEANNAGMALAGIITGSIGMAIGAAFLGFIIWAAVSGGL